MFLYFYMFGLLVSNMSSELVAPICEAFKYYIKRGRGVAPSGEAGASDLHINSRTWLCLQERNVIYPYFKIDFKNELVVQI